MIGRAHSHGLGGIAAPHTDHRLVAHRLGSTDINNTRLKFFLDRLECNKNITDNNIEHVLPLAYHCILRLINLQ